MIRVNNLTITVKTEPECEGFLRIKCPDEDYQPIEKFIEMHENASSHDLDNCLINYRGTERTYKEFIDEHVAFSNSLEFVNFNSSSIIVDDNINASRYFMRKAIDCLQNARLFAMKSQLIIDTNSNVNWATGYVAQFAMRCVYFDTAATWYSNTFDQLLQAVYWAYELYTNAVDRYGNKYNDAWDAKKTMTFCTYKFVVKELKSRGLTAVRKKLTVCSGKIEEIRKWANYIKHKGGIEYKYLEPDDPFKIYITSTKENAKQNSCDKRFAIDNFKSPIEIDIDEKITVYADVHKALHECITSIIEEIDYESHKLQLGGN